MRQDPDIILIGEIRDMETAQAALKAAETGHLVISTLHAKTTVTSVSRMLDLFAGEELKSVRNRFSDVLRGIVSQKLVRSTLEDGLRVPVNEILLNTNQLRLALENGGTPTELRAILEKGKEFGMQTFEQHFTDLVALGLVTEKIALAQAGDPDQMKIMLANLAEEKKLAEVSLPAKTKMSFPPTKIAPAIPFSVRVKEEEQASGVVITPSGAAFALPKAPIRPDIYLPPK
jgi:twitching motility protein PilT